MRSALRYLVSSLLVGVLSVGLAWAGAGLVPVKSPKVGGFFDRKFLSSPAEVRTGKSPDTAPCESASPVSVEVAATAAFVGHQLAITAGPGELFSNLTNTIREKSGALVTMPLAQAKDALGYLPQSFELNPVGQQGPEDWPERSWNSEKHGWTVLGTLARVQVLAG